MKRNRNELKRDRRLNAHSAPAHHGGSLKIGIGVPGRGHRPQKNKARETLRKRATRIALTATRTLESDYATLRFSPDQPCK